MMLVVRTDLKMSQGKTGAQTAHAAVGLSSQLLASGQGALLAHWTKRGQTKICLAVGSLAELKALERTASEAGLQSYLVCDAGRTEVASGSETVLAIGPAPPAVMHPITGKLRLLR